MSERPKRILIVDDNPDDRALVCREAHMLFPGAELREAGSRDEFERAAKDRAYDLVVTDLELKWGNGREVLAEIRAEHPGCAVIMFTDSGDEMTAVELMKAGLDDYVVKSTRQLPRLRASMKLATDQAQSRSELSKRERQLKAALAQQELVVRELHHRVRNNIQTIISLVELRARTAEEPLASELAEIGSRMRAIAAVQSRIYNTETLDRVDFAGCLTDVASQVTKALGSHRIQLIPEVDGRLELDVHRAMPLALFCHEVILNSLKHAWPHDRAGKLMLRIVSTVGARQIQIVDDGVGFVAAEVTKGLGTKLARGLAAEAHARVEVQPVPGRGTTVTISLDDASASCAVADANAYRHP